MFFLGQKSEPATKQDLSVGQDLQDTLIANRDRCVGMAANMIGVKKYNVRILLAVESGSLACRQRIEVPLHDSRTKIMVENEG